MIIDYISFLEGEITVVIYGEEVFPVRLKEGDVIFVHYRFYSERSNVAQPRHVRVETLNSVICNRPGGVLLQDKNDRIGGMIHFLFATNNSGLNWIVDFFVTSGCHEDIKRFCSKLSCVICRIDCECSSGLVPRP